VHGFAVDNKLPIYSRTSHLFCECNDVGHRQMRVEPSRRARGLVVSL
jgi:hypothetical protein